MEKPLCPICKERHYGVEHIWPKDNGTGLPSIIAVAKAYSGSTPDTKPAPVVDSGGAGVVRGLDLPRPLAKVREKDRKRFDRTAYQREYMRKRRAKLIRSG